METPIDFFSSCRDCAPCSETSFYDPESGNVFSYPYPCLFPYHDLGHDLYCPLPSSPMLGRTEKIGEQAIEMAIAASVVVVTLLGCLLGRASGDEACGHFSSSAQTETGLPAGFPWHVLLYTNSTKDNERRYLCGGSLIKPKWAVFAAHCFSTGPGYKPDAYGLSLGKTTRSWGSVENWEQHRMVKQIVTNDYKGHEKDFANDIALVELDQDAAITATVWPICVDLTGTLLPLHSGDEGIMAGYGGRAEGEREPPKDLKYARIRHLGREDCLKAIGEKPRLAAFLDGTDKFCVDALKGSAIGIGDSAAGFAMKAPDGRWFLQGVTSVGDRGSSLSFFTNVTTHASWMSGVIKQ